MSDIIPTEPKPRSLIVKIAERYSVEPAKLADTLKATAFKSSTPVTNEQLMALLIVADQYGLNPFTKELFAFPDKGGIVPVVSLDGWARIVNSHPMFDGMAFVYDREEQSYTCTIYRKDRAHPTVITEHLAECRRSTPPWQSHPRRMLRHKALIQCARLAFGFAGIYDPDEAERIVHPQASDVVEPPSTSAAQVRHAMKGKPLPMVEEVRPEPEPAPEPAPEAVDHASLLATYRAAVSTIPEADKCGLVLDEARSLFTEQEAAELNAIYAARFDNT